MLPIKNGIEILNNLRNKNILTPIIMLTAKGELKDKVTGLKNGADDYLTKPFSFEELQARIEALYRRTLKNASNIINLKNITIDLFSRS
jgi:two-component system OmpR family response regulator